MPDRDRPATPITTSVASVAERAAEVAWERADFPATLPPRLRPCAELGVLDVTEYYAATSGGIRTYLLEKARHVEARAALRQVLVVPAAEASIASASGVRRYELYGPPIPAQKPYRFLLAARALRRILVHERPDLVEVGSPAIVPWLARFAGRGTGIPLVWFYHSNIPRLFAPRFDAKGAAGTPWRARRALAYLAAIGNRFHATLATSAFSERDLARAGVANVHRVSLGVDLDRFHPGRTTARATTRARIGLGDGPLVLYSGRIAREKELDVLLAAWPAIARRTGGELALVGSGPLAAELRARARVQGLRGVHWLAFEHDRDRLADLYAAADLYVSPCSIETFGIAALEAQACGTPTLSADQGGVAERVARSRAGALFRSGDPESLAAAAIELLGKDLAPLARLARDDAEREHAWEHVFARIFDVYAKVLGR